MNTRNDKVHLTVLFSIDSFAIAINLALIVAVLLRTPKPLRSYAVFLLNNAIIDMCSAASSALGTVRLIDNMESKSMIYIFIGPCALASEHLCRMCQSMHLYLVLQSTLILLFSFAYRLYILAESFPKPLSRLQIWIICVVAYILLILPVITYYRVQAVVPPQYSTQYKLQGYAKSIVYLLDPATLAMHINNVVLSPIVIAIIFVVRRKLIAGIAQSITNKKQHEFIARALTFQMMLPCGVAAAAAVWMLDLSQLWSSEFSERLIMVLFNIFSLASPLINFTMLPPYRSLIPFLRNAKKSSRSVGNIDFTTMEG